MLERLREFLKSDEGKASLANYAAKRKRETEQVMRVGTYLEGKDFDALLKRLIDEHTEEYRLQCYKKGEEPSLTHKMGLLFAYVSKVREEVYVAQIQNNILFSSTLRFFKGYYFGVVHGQGCFHEIYNDKFERIFVC